MMFYQPQYRADEGTGHVQCVVVLSIQWSIDIIVQVITINGSAMGESCSILTTVDTVVV